MRYSWVILESQDRWSRAVRSFGADAVPGDEDRLSIIEVEDVDECLQEIIRDPVAIVLWELPESDASEILRAISSIRASARHPLQLVAHSCHARIHGSLGHEIEMTLREIGADATLLHTTDLVRWIPMIRRRWEQSQQEDNLSAIQQIWDRLPWE